MRQFLRHILLFSVILFVLAWVADILITRPFKKLSSSPFANWNDIYNRETGSDVLVMGSSRAYVQFDPRILDTILHVNSYNLGCNGQHIDAQIIKYKIYRQHQQTKPRLILLELSPKSIDSSNQYEKIQYLPYLHDPYLWQLTQNMEKFSIADGFLPCWRYLNFKKDVSKIIKGTSFYSRPNRTLYKGFFGFDKAWDGSAFQKIRTINYSRNPKIAKELEHFLDDCNHEEIQVVFVMAPYYMGATRKIHDLEGMHRMFDSIAQKHDIPLLDYTNDSICYDTTYFYNAMHLNRTGATLFTTQLAHDLEKMGIIP